MSHTFSLLSKGYGTWDGVAKYDRNDFLDRTSGYFSLDEFYLPSIETNYQRTERTDDRKDNAAIFYQNKPFKLPNVEDNTLYPLAPVPKTYTTRKGALLLYAEDYFIPCSPKKSRRKKKKPKRQSAVIFKTLGDLRNSVLNYKKNGGDPLFLKLLQKSYSNYRELTVRPGFSPKRYIANLCRMHQEDSWKKYVRSLTDHDAEFLTLPDKPQPYSTMSLPPISPSGSMVDSSFNFYQNGMSTGAASLISINSEDVPEYAFSSRALSPLESLSERLSEVEILPYRKDNKYASLKQQQKADILSQLLVQSTLQGDSDMQNWVNDKLTESGNNESRHSISRFYSTIGKPKVGNLKSASNFSSCLPPIQSAGALSTPPSTVSTSQNNFGFVDLDISHTRENSNEHANSDVLDPSAVELFLNNNSDQEEVLEMVGMIDTEQKSISQRDSNLDNSISSGINSHSSKTFVNEENGEILFESMPLRHSETNLEKHYEDTKSFKPEVKFTSSGTFDASTAAKESAEQELQELDLKGNENRNHSKMDDDTSVSKIEIKAESLPVEDADSRSNVAESNSSSLPPHISIEELHGHAKLVATKVLSRPKSGTSFQEDAKEAVAMWADRLSSILGPPSKEPRICSAGLLPTTIPRGDGEDSVTAADADGAYLFSTATRQKKKSFSANPSAVALRDTLKISGENGKYELLHAVDSLADKINKMPARENPEIPNRIKNGHIYHEPSKDEDADGSPGPTKSIQSERVSLCDIQMDIVSIVTGQKEDTLNYQQAELLSELASEEEEKFREAVLSVLSNHSDQIRTVLPEQSKAEEAKAKPETSSGKSRTSVIKSNKTKTSTATPPFQVSTRPKTEKPPTSLYSAPKTETKEAKQGKKLTKVKKATGKVPKQSKEKQNVKGKAKKKRAKKSQIPKAEEEITMEPVEEEKSVSPIRVNSETGEKEPEVFRVASSDSTSKSSVIASSKVASPEVTPVSPASDTPKLVRRAVEKTEDAKSDEKEANERLKEEQEQKERDSKAQRKAAIAAERAAAAERRRLEVERKRREREETKRKALEEEARLETLRMQEEEEMRRKEEERRRLREEKEEENRRKVEQEKEQERLAQAKLERERRQREEWKRKQQELLEKRKREEELKREQEKLEAEIAAAAKREQLEKLKAMEETERIAFEERMKREEEELRKRLELQRLKEEEEKRLQEEHRRKHQEQLALLRHKQIQRQLFLAALAREKFYLSLDQRMTRAFTYSYFALLPWCFLENLKPNCSLEDRSPISEKLLTVPEEDS